MGRKFVLALMVLLAVTGVAFGQTKQYKIGVTLYDRDQFISSLEQAILEAAKKVPNVVVDSQDAKQDVNQQMAQVDVFATKKYDAIIVNLINTDTVETIISRAKGIPVIFVNRRPRDAVIDGIKTAYVGSQEFDAGKMQEGEFLAQFFKGKTELRYVLFMGQLGLENTLERTRGVKENPHESRLQAHQGLRGYGRMGPLQGHEPDAAAPRHGQTLRRRHVQQR